MIGQTILGYHVDEKIGAGGFGTVYKVSKTNAAGTYVRALKHITLPTKKQYASVLNSMGGDYSKADDYFASVLNDIVSEISILSTLSESGVQNIVRYYENDIVETLSPKRYDVYILMEFLTPFTDYLENHNFTVRDVITLGKDILTALKACHSKNIIHRDIKDDNIFVSPDGVYKLGDFGVSKALKDKSKAESVKGTPNFIAPEVYLGKEKYDNTVDIYSLGIVLYKLLNKSRNPFMPKFPASYDSRDEDTAFEARMRGDVPSLPYSAENELGQAVLKAILPRKDRYNTAEEFYDALDNAQKTLSQEELSADLGIFFGCNIENGNGSEEKTVRKATSEENKTYSLFQDREETVAMPETDRIPAASGAKTIGLFDTADLAGATQGFGDTAQTMIKDELNDNDRTVAMKKDPPRINDNYTDQKRKQSAPSTPKVEKSPVNSFDNDAVSEDWQDYSEFYAPPVDTTKKSFKWLLYLTPILIVGVWLTVYLFLLPAAYDKAVSFIEWFVGNPLAIVDAIKDSSNVFTPIYQIILLMAYNWLSFIGLVVSLFFIGLSLQNKKPEQNNRAKLRGKEPYTITIGLLEEIKMINNAKVEKARKAVYSLNEKLRHESAFGEGSDTVINCENEIAKSLNAIQALLPGLYDDATVEVTTNEIDMHCKKCLAKLRLRIELKKK